MRRLEVGLSFYEDDVIDKESLREEILKEATDIFMSPKARGNRTLEQVIDNTRQGKVPEFYLRQEFENIHNLSSSTLYLLKDRRHLVGYRSKWNDLVTDKGFIIEVKSISIDSGNYEANIKERLIKVITDKNKGINFSDFIIFFKFFPDLRKYTLTHIKSLS